MEINDIIRPENKVYSKPELLEEVHMHYCPGCSHGVIHKLVAEVVAELGLTDRTIGISPVGCAVFAYNYIDVDWVEAAHGRAPAVATAISRLWPENVVFTYQGDGDMSAIGTAESIHAANRGENIVMIFVNNAIYGMTGGQMAPTTLLGMKATTAPQGRDPREHGYPMHMCEILNQLTAPCYLARTSCNTPANVARTKDAIRKAFRNQLAGKGFSMVEIVTSCPTNWGLDPLEALDFLEEKMLKEFPLGVIRDRSGEEA